MDKNEWIAIRIMEIQREVQSKADYCEERGIPFYGSSECASEEAEQEYISLYGNDDEDYEEYDELNEEQNNFIVEALCNKNKSSSVRNDGVTIYNLDDNPKK